MSFWKYDTGEFDRVSTFSLYTIISLEFSSKLDPSLVNEGFYTPIQLYLLAYYSSCWTLYWDPIIFELTERVTIEDGPA